MQRFGGKIEKSGVNERRIGWEVIKEEKSGVNEIKLDCEEVIELLKSRTPRALWT